MGAEYAAIGAGAAHISAEIDQPDTNFILRLWDYAQNGKRQLISSGYLKTSHRELDERSTVGSPHHPHTRAVPVGRPVTHKIYRDAAHQSRLVLLFTTRKAAEDQAN